MNTLAEGIESSHASLLELTDQLDALLNYLPSDRPAERNRAIQELRRLIPAIELRLKRCRCDEQDLFASGLEFPLSMRDRQREEIDELLVLLEIVEAESWHLRAAPAIGFLCLLRSLCARIRGHVEHESEVLHVIDAHVEPVLVN